MAGVFRFSNAVSDIRKFIETYKVIYDELKETKNFTHDNATDALIKYGLVSSSGAIGGEAVIRSRRVDRSRDPLYNQLKMYSEIYRMLGWYWPGTKRTNFIIPEYGEYIYDAQGALLKSHFELNVLHIVSPNALVSIKSGNILRPFPLILKLLDKLGGYIHRDEIILTILACPDDTNDDYVDNSVKYINGLRGSKERLDSAYKALMKAHGINSVDVFRNYTRFIMATLKWLGYAEPERVKNMYGSRAIQMYKQTDYGKRKALEIENYIDIREVDLENYSFDERAGFSLYSFYFHLGNIGYDLSDSETKQTILELKEICQRILSDFSISEGESYLYFPYQESSKDVMERAKTLLDK